MGISKTEINLRRLLQAAPKQQNQAKLIHYVSTSRELLEQLAAETTPEGLPRVSKAKVNDYSEKIESIAAKLAASLDDDSQVLKDPSARAEIKETTEIVEEEKVLSSPPGLRKRAVPSSSSINDRPHNNDSSGDQSTVKLDDAAVTHIDKHRKLQEDLTDEMVGLARQLKESSLMMSRSVQNTEKILDSTEKAVEQSLASTGHATARATQVFSQSSKTSCFTWLLMFFMICVFIMVVLLIRIT